MTEYPGDSLRAARKVLNSERLRPVLSWALGTALGVAGGWTAHVFTDKAEIAGLRTDVQEQTKEIKALRAFIMADLLGPGVEGVPAGKITQLQADQRIVMREILRARGLALAGETSRVRKAKNDSARDHVEAFDNRTINRTRERLPPIAAYDEVIEKVALP